MNPSGSPQRILATARAGNWWSSKLPPLLSIAYAIFLVDDTAPAIARPALAITFAVLCLLAWYAHVVNDLTDLEEDRRAGKRNRMAGLPVMLGVVIALALAGAAGALASRRQPSHALVALGLNFAVFSLYSIPPVRLKRRRWWGAAADALGAHVLPTAYVAFALASHWSPLHVALLISAFGWSGAAGLRGILVHQVLDRDADERAGLQTVATTTSTVALQRLVLRAILPVEGVSLALFISFLLPTAPLLAVTVAAAGILEWLKVRRRWTLPLFEPAQRSHEPYRPLLNNDPYELWLPVTLVVQLAWSRPAFAAVAVAHLLLFGGSVLARARQALRVLRDAITLGLPLPADAEWDDRPAPSPARSPDVKRANVILGLTGGDTAPGDPILVRLARAFEQGRVGALLLTTERDSRLPEAERSSRSLPPDIRAVPLDVRAWESWGTHWGALVQLLESHAPCVFVTHNDWRHACITPLLSDGVGVVAIVESVDPGVLEQVSRLGRFWNTIVATHAEVATAIATRNPDLADRVVALALGRREREGGATREPPTTDELAFVSVVQRTLDEVAGGRFLRPPGEVEPPPGPVAERTVFSRAFPFRVRGAGEFESREEWFAFRARLARPSSAGRPARERVPDRVVVAAPCWIRNGANVASARLVRGLVAAGVDARLLLTEEHTKLVTVDAPRLALDHSLPAETLPVPYDAGWGTHWGAMERYLADRAPCVYLPTFDWRHACIVPRLGPDVRTILHVSRYAPASLEQAKRLAPYVAAVIVSREEELALIHHEIPSLGARAVYIPEGHQVPDTLPARASHANDVVQVVVCDRSWDGEPLQLSMLRQELAHAGLTTRFHLLGSAAAPEIAPTLPADSYAEDCAVAWPPPDDLFVQADFVILAPAQGASVPREAWEAMGGGCIPILVGHDLPVEGFRAGDDTLRIRRDDERPAERRIAEAVVALWRDAARREAARRQSHDLAWRSVIPTRAAIDGYLDLFERVLTGAPSHPPAPGGHPLILPPPREVEGVGILPIDDPWTETSVGRFPSQEDYDDYLAAAGHPAP